MKAPPIPLLLALNIVLTVAAQSMLRAGMRGIQLEEDIPRFIWRAATNGLAIGGVVMFGVSLLLWLALLSKMKLSILYPMQQGLVFIGIQIVGVEMARRRRFAAAVGGRRCHLPRRLSRF